jgi:hypothetical protein
MNNFPFLKSKKGIVLFYDSKTLSIYGYSFKDINEDEEPVILLTGGFFTNEVQKHHLSVFRRVYGNLFEDLSFIDEIKDYILDEVESHIKNADLDESDNYGLLKERLFDILYVLFINKLFPFNPYEMIAGTWIFVRMTIDSIFRAGKSIPFNLLEARAIVDILEKRNDILVAPLLPLGDQIVIGTGSMTMMKDGELQEYGWIDPVLYKSDFYTKEKLVEFIKSFYKNFFIEYKTLVEKNFPNHKKNFDLYNILPCHLVCEIEEVQNIYGGDFPTRLLNKTIFKDDSISNEIEICLKNENPMFDDTNYTVRTKNGVIKLENWIEWSKGSDRYLFSPKGIGKNNQILREFIYNYIQKEVTKDTIKI